MNAPAQPDRTDVLRIALFVSAIADCMEQDKECGLGIALLRVAQAASEDLGGDRDGAVASDALQAAAVLLSGSPWTARDLRRMAREWTRTAGAQNAALN